MAGCAHPSACGSTWVSAHLREVDPAPLVLPTPLLCVQGTYGGDGRAQGLACPAPGETHVLRAPRSGSYWPSVTAKCRRLTASVCPTPDTEPHSRGDLTPATTAWSPPGITSILPVGEGKRLPQVAQRTRQARPSCPRSHPRVRPSGGRPIGLQGGCAVTGPGDSHCTKVLLLPRRQVPSQRVSPSAVAPAVCQSGH